MTATYLCRPGIFSNRSTAMEIQLQLPAKFDRCARSRRHLYPRSAGPKSRGAHALANSQSKCRAFAHFENQLRLHAIYPLLKRLEAQQLPGRQIMIWRNRREFFDPAVYNIGEMAGLEPECCHRLVTSKLPAALLS